jgi:hypothetical protein
VGADGAWVQTVRGFQEGAEGGKSCGRVHEQRHKERTVLGGREEEGAGSVGSVQR